MLIPVVWGRVAVEYPFEGFNKLDRLPPEWLFVPLLGENDQLFCSAYGYWELLGEGSIMLSRLEEL